MFPFLFRCLESDLFFILVHKSWRLTSLTMESAYEPVIPGLPDDVALRCLAMVSHGHHGLLESVSKKWRNLIRSTDYSCYVARKGWSGDWLFVLGENYKNLWIAYDPDADRWHPLPPIRGDFADLQHVGFSCVCVSNRLLVIGGYYAPCDAPPFKRRPYVTNRVLQFDPFKKQWSSVARMRTPRSHFACGVISGKVYVAGGRNLSSMGGLALAEVYDPLMDKWEELPPMPEPEVDCVALSYKGNFQVLSDQVGLSDTNITRVYNPSNKTWCTVEDIWPFSRAMQFAVQVMYGRVYTVADGGENVIKARDLEGSEWYDVGSIPSIILPDHARALETFCYGFAALRDELYILGGKVLRWEDTGTGRFDIMKLRCVRVCNPAERPIKWRETRPMCWLACGSILGCASLEENASS